ncbi:MAG: hypothetical protein V3S55_15570 [Nitrospiraceae bacterium]
MDMFLRKEVAELVKRVDELAIRNARLEEALCFTLSIRCHMLMREARISKVIGILKLPGDLANRLFSGR